MTNKLSSTVIRYSVSTLVVAMILVTACVGVVTWYGVHSGGISWAQSSARASLALMTYLSEGWDLRGQSIAQDTPDEIRSKVAANEVAIISLGRKVEQIIAHPESQSWFSSSDSHSVLNIRASGFYKIGQAYSYVVKKPYTGGQSQETFFLIRKLAKKDFLFAFKMSSNAEVVVLHQSLLESTFVNQAGHTVLPVFETQDLESILQTPKGSFFNRVIRIKVDNYAGYEVPTSSEKVIVYHKGKNELKAYSSFFPIVNADGSTAGHLGILVPEDALLAGVKKGLLISFIVMAVLIAASAALVSRFSHRLTGPLTVTTQRLTQLSKVLSQNFQINGKSGEEEKKGSSAIREIAKLQEATYRLEKIFYQSEEIRIAIDNERAKSFTASKMAALGEISAGIAHEINTPLAAISMLSGQIQSMVEGGDHDYATIKQLAERVEATTFKIAKIIKGLQSYSRDASHDPMSAYPLKQIIEDSLALCADAFKKSSIKLSLDEVSPNLQLSCRPAQISQVLLNLINNARDAIEHQDNPWIKISIEEREDEVSILVTDSGNGIPNDIKEKLFHPFFTTKPIGKGTGLGLSVSEKIVTSHGGRLELASHSPYTCFVLTLPRHLSASLPLAA